ncbi:MAG: hypothetical protein JJT77_11810 [Crocinitomicaceae bacterium]|nr:hypothetical protein [Crocinitomicaceae bacterium]
MGKTIFENIEQIKIKDYKHKLKDQQKTTVKATIQLKTGKSQIIEFRAKESNLIKGAKVWFFVCPIKGLYCRKLFLTDEYGFIGRKSFKNVLYLKQTYSSQIRERYAPLWEWNVNKYSDRINKPYFKTHYKGKETKRYKYLKEKDKEAKEKEQKALQLLHFILIKK